MRIRFTILFLASFLLSCSSVDQIPDIEISEVRMTIEDMLFEQQTRTEAYFSTTGVKYNWLSTDTVGIYPVGKGSQIEFPIEQGTGSSSAVFDGGGWAVKQGYSYVAFYPFDYANRSNKKIPLDYTGQKQRFGSEGADCGAKDYIVANGAAPSDGKISFTFKHIGSIILLRLTSPDPIEFNKLTLSVDESIIPVKSNLDLSTGSTVITPKNYSDRLEVVLSGIKATVENPTFDLWVLLPPVNLLNKDFAAKLTAIDGSAYSVLLTPKDYVAGKAYMQAHTLVKTEEAGVDSGLNFTFESGEMTDGETIEIEGGTEEQ